MKLNDLNNIKLKNWILETADMCTPDSIEICDGSQEEYDRLSCMMVESGTYIRLNERKAPRQLPLPF